MSIRNRGFRWWWWRLALMLAFSTWLTYELLEQGLFVTRNIPPGGIDGPVCYETGGLFSRNASVFRYIECAHFHGSSVAAYLLTPKW